MYTRCLFCSRDLARNQALEAFPVGRRLAFDAAKGRLWVVCTGCGRWNLTPLEERWEAIEQAERLFRGTRLRTSTDNVGLARVRDGTDLVRVGAPLRPEFAAWRYGRLFERRWRRALLAGAVLAPPAAGLAVASVVAPLVAASAVPAASGFVGMLAAAYVAGRAVDGLATLLSRGADFATRHDPDRVVAWVADRATGASAPVRSAGVHQVQFGRAPDGAVAVGVVHEHGTSVLTRDAAERLLVRLTPVLNDIGAPPGQVSAAVRAIDVRRGPARYLDSLSLTAVRAWEGVPPSERVTRAAGDGVQGVALGALSDVQRLALEMALHEEQERRAMDGELEALERAWRDAEAIAAIADDLAVPDRVLRAAARLRDRRGG